MKSHLRTALILAVTLALIALFLRNANLADVWADVRRADVAPLLAAVVTTGLTYLMRAWRWQVMLAPIGPARLSVAFRTTVIGFAANALLPARVGEVLRPLLLARREGLNATSCFATIVLERVLDLVTVLTLLGVFVLMSDASVTSADPRLFRAVQSAGLLALVASAAGLATFFVLAGHPERLGAVTARLSARLPARVAAPLVRLVTTFAEGLTVMRQPRTLAWAVVLSVPLWLSIAAGIWLVSQAFHITMPFTGTFLIAAFLTVGVAAPTPGAVGGFHVAYRIGATVFFGASNEAAVGAAIVLHAISVFPVAVLGLLFMAQDGVHLGRLGALRTGGAPAVAATAEHRSTSA